MSMEGQVGAWDCDERTVQQEQQPSLNRCLSRSSMSPNHIFVRSRETRNSSDGLHLKLRSDLFSNHPKMVLGLSLIRHCHSPVNSLPEQTPDN